MTATNQGGEGSEEKFFSFSSEAEGGAEAEGEASEAEDQSEAATAEEADGDEPPLFTDDPDSDEGDEPETDEESEEEDEGLSLDDDSEEPQDEKARFQKTLRERLARQKGKYERKVAKLEAQLREKARGSEMEQALRAMYPDKEEPFGAFLADKLVMDEMLRMQSEGYSGAEPFIRDALARAKARSKGESVPSTKPEAAEKSTSVSDARVEKLVAKQVMGEIDQFLVENRVKPEWRGALRKELSAQLGKVDIDDLSHDAIREVVPKALRALGVRAEVVQERKKREQAAKGAPATGSPRSAAKSATTRAKDEGAKKEDAPKSIREWRNQGDSLLESLRAG